MSQSYFRFKQFTVQQECAAMKVSTDACIQGAWTPVPSGTNRVLDIGTGTGLLSLMIAQRHPPAMIDALELDAAAAGQAFDNVAASPFADRISVHHTDAKVWQPVQPYDLIICNPPFFHKALKGPDAARNVARHSDHLGVDTLLGLTSHWLSADGIASFLWPTAEHAFFAQKAPAFDLVLRSTLQIQHRAGSAVSRVISVWGKASMAASVEALIIKDEQDAYTDRFRQLLSPFYLQL